MRVQRMLPASHLYPSDSTQQHPTRAGMGQLRHNSRHKIFPRSGPSVKGWGPLFALRLATAGRSCKIFDFRFFQFSIFLIFPPDEFFKIG